MAEDNRSKKTFVAGAALLGLAGIVVKVLGVFFRVPLANIIGAEGMGIYGVAYPIYILMLTISSSGLPTAISRMIAERRSVGQYYEAYRVFKVSFKVMLGLGLATGIILFVFAPVITGIQKEPEAVMALRATAPALVLCPIMSCYRGFFQGQKSMGPTALSQVVEQVFRVGIGIGLCMVLSRIGLAEGAAGASFGASAGALFGLIAVMFRFVQNKPKMLKEISESGRKPIQPMRGIILDLLAIAIPITIGAAIMPILNGIDTIIVKNRLLSLGYNDTVARTLYGELSGLASPIINVPQVLTQAIALSLVPVISDAFRRDDMDFVRKNSALGLRYSALVGLPCSLGIIALAKPIMQLFYPTQTASHDNAAACLIMYAIGLFFLSGVHSLTGVLQGIGKQGIPVRNLFIGALVKVVVTFLLTGIPAINVKGAAIGTTCAYVVAFLLNLAAVVKFTSLKVDLKLMLIGPLISSGVMFAVVFGAYRLLRAHSGNAVSTLASVCIGVLVYVIMIFVTRSVRLSELSSMPLVGKVIRKLGRR